jgi:hypothetical protein
VLAHVSGSVAFFTCTHAPDPVAHVMHVPLQAPLQHTPSSQTPLVHCWLDVHAPPAPVSVTQLPTPLQ